MSQDNGSGLSVIGQISVTVQDLDRAVSHLPNFYRDQLGMQFLFRVPGMAFFNCSGVRLLLGLSEDESSGCKRIRYLLQGGRPRRHA